MQGGCFKVCLFTGYFFLVTMAANAQEVVHALCGTVRSIDSTTKAITVGTDSGAPALFKELTKPDVRLDFDKRIRAEATAPDTFTKNGDHVIIFYFGSGDAQTAVALRDLGAGPFEEIGGTVVKFDKRERVLTLRNNSGTEESFHLELKTVAETPYGATQGLELDAKSGDEVQVTGASVNGGKTALFIRLM